MHDRDGSAESSLSVEAGPGGGSVLRLEGVLDFGSVPWLHGKAAHLFDGQSRVVVDMQGVTHANSAGLALLLEWKRLSDSAGTDMAVRGLPETLRNIAHMCELEPLLPARSD